ncbi:MULTISPECIES: peptidoglycan-binding domain-containing protein [unclassified Azospirillum]|uniref:peptidoglycan-binding domain-containing protein n=1 Tax=unclassified Azospirillum TaxID=2630922 RepID=UPI000B71DA3E|nr:MULTISPECIES: peptidoglycan-binding domain-containing protein [unclassified Azospirillum]SNR89185.1 Phage Mu protein F like protein [Azospirillum sp. RU38E]SNS05312.1 Phage Mu protein F like protein [Azospirillum sp. RU37A]
MELELKRAVARNVDADPNDILNLKRVLNRLGHYLPDDLIGMTRFAETRLFEAIEAFQRLTELTPTGQVKPDDETVQTLQEYLARTSGNDRYIWRTVRDDRVRPSHAAREGKLFRWKAWPEPGEEEHCRCWAELVDDAASRDGAAAAGAAGKTAKDDEPHCFQEPWLDEAVEMLVRHEDAYEYPYGDSLGFITVGVGANVNQWDQFKSLPWRMETEDGRFATLTEVTDGYEKLRKFIDDARAEAEKNGEKKINYLAKKYKKITKLRLSSADYKKMLKDSVQQFEKDLRKKFSGFSCFPTPAKIVLMDMIYNIGTTKFNAEKWKNLFAAIAIRDWGAAAQQSNRNAIPDERNKAVRTYFEKAKLLEEEKKTKS